MFVIIYVLIFVYYVIYLSIVSYVACLCAFGVQQVILYIRIQIKQCICIMRRSMRCVKMCIFYCLVFAQLTLGYAKDSYRGSSDFKSFSDKNNYLQKLKTQYFQFICITSLTMYLANFFQHYCITFVNGR